MTEENGKVIPGDETEKNGHRMSIRTMMMMTMMDEFPLYGAKFQGLQRNIVYKKESRRSQ